MDIIIKIIAILAVAFCLFVSIRCFSIITKGDK